MRFDIITVFPKIFGSYFNESMIKRARAKKLLDIWVHDLRDYVKVAPRQARGNLPQRRQVDARPYGGGPGMVLKIEPLARALDSMLKNKSKPRPFKKERGKKIKDKTKVILFSAAGKQFNAKMADVWAKNYNRIIMIAGHYEGVDERIKRIFRMQESSVGP